MKPTLYPLLQSDAYSAHFFEGNMKSPRNAQSYDGGGDLVEDYLTHHHYGYFKPLKIQCSVLPLGESLHGLVHNEKGSNRKTTEDLDDLVVMLGDQTQTQDEKNDSIEFERSEEDVFHSVKSSPDIWIENNYRENTWRGKIIPIDVGLVSEQEVDESDDIEIVAERIKKRYPSCAERIRYLRDSDDIEEGEQPLNPESVKGFEAFITKFNFLGRPTTMGLFSQGTLSVEWRIADNKHLLVEPLDSKNACFALIAPSDDPEDSKDGRSRLNGKQTIKEVIQTLQDKKVDRWKKDR